MGRQSISCRGTSVAVRGEMLSYRFPQRVMRRAQVREVVHRQRRDLPDTDRVILPAHCACPIR